MGSSYPDEWDKLIGPIPAHVIFEVAREWVLKAYFENEPAAFLGIGIIPRKTTDSIPPSHIAAHEWLGDIVDNKFVDSVYTTALDSYEDIISDCEKIAKEKTGKLNSPFYSVKCCKLNKKIPYMAYGVLRTEKFIFFAFAPYRVTDEANDSASMYCSFFELVYVICRAIAPSSDFAFNLIQNWQSQLGSDPLMPYKIRKRCIVHADEALCGRQFKSVIEWRHQ